MKSNVVILLGELVAEFFKSRRGIRIIACPFTDGLLLKWAGIDDNGVIILAVAHPSYVGIYARRRLGDYADVIFHAVQGLLQGSASLKQS